MFLEHMARAIMLIFINVGSGKTLADRNFCALQAPNYLGYIILQCPFANCFVELFVTHDATVVVSERRIIREIHAANYFAYGSWRMWKALERAGEQVVNIGYRFERGTLEQAEVSGAWPVSRSWNAFVRGVYSLRDDKALERFVGFEYRACCWRARFGGRRFVSTHAGSQDTGVFLQLELTGLASVGSASDAFLTEAIRGYAPPETSLRTSKAN